MRIIKTKYDENYFENLFYRGSSNSQRNKNRIREILEYKINGALLEVGCGKGNFLKEAEKYFDVTGFDVSNYAINEAKKMLGNKVSVENIEQTDLRPNHYDVIVAFNLLEHLKNPNNAIKKIYGALKNGGILIGSVPNNYGVVGGLATLLFNAIDKTHCSTYSPHIWNKYFLKHGFKDILFFGEIATGINNNFYVKNIFWKFLSFNLMFVCKK